MIAQSLVIEHKLSNFVWELFALPLTLQTAGLLALTFRRRRACSPDRIGCRAQFVSCHMSNHRSLSGGVRRISCRTAQLSGSAHGVSTGGTGLSHRDFTSHPGAS